MPSRVDAVCTTPRPRPRRRCQSAGRRWSRRGCRGSPGSAAPALARVPGPRRRARCRPPAGSAPSEALCGRHSRRPPLSQPTRSSDGLKFARPRRGTSRFVASEARLSMALTASPTVWMTLDVVSDASACATSRATPTSSSPAADERPRVARQHRPLRRSNGGDVPEQPLQRLRRVGGAAGPAPPALAITAGAHVAKSSAWRDAVSS